MKLLNKAFARNSTYIEGPAPQKLIEKLKALPRTKVIIGKDGKPILEKTSVDMQVIHDKYNPDSDKFISKQVG